jgi:hypothetical protein
LYSNSAHADLRPKSAHLKTPRLYIPFLPLVSLSPSLSRATPRCTTLSLSLSLGGEAPLRLWLRLMAQHLRRRRRARGAPQSPPVLQQHLCPLLRPLSPSPHPCIEGSSSFLGSFGPNNPSSQRCTPDLVIVPSSRRSATTPARTRLPPLERSGAGEACICPDTPPAAAVSRSRWQRPLASVARSTSERCVVLPLPSHAQQGLFLGTRVDLVSRYEYLLCSSASSPQYLL